MSEHEGIAMAFICPGTFTMGSPSGEEGRDADEFQHEVTLTGAYWMGEYEVTQAEFAWFMGYQAACYTDSDDFPVECLKWHEAAAFANAVSRAAGVDECYSWDDGEEDLVICTTSRSPYFGEGYRLPTEAEWENAARAGTEDTFSNEGNLDVADIRNCTTSVVLDNGEILGDIAVYCGSNTGQPSEAGTKDANPSGLYDMHGNLRERCQDWYWSDYAGDVVTDPWGDIGGSTRVIRGGSRRDAPRDLRSADRSMSGSGGGSGDLGFRLARSD